MTHSRAGARELGYESWFLDFAPPERPISHRDLLPWHLQGESRSPPLPCGPP